MDLWHYRIAVLQLYRTQLQNKQRNQNKNGEFINFFFINVAHVNIKTAFKLKINVIFFTKKISTNFWKCHFLIKNCKIF